MASERKRTAGQARITGIPDDSDEEVLFQTEDEFLVPIKVKKAAKTGPTGVRAPIQRFPSPRTKSVATSSTSISDKSEPPQSFLTKHGTQMVDIIVGEKKQLFRVSFRKVCFFMFSSTIIQTSFKTNAHRRSTKTFYATRSTISIKCSMETSRKQPRIAQYFQKMTLKPSTY